jgi:MFS family permease
MTAGSCVAVVLTLAWSRVSTLSEYYAIWAGIGVTMACVLYQPAFAALATWFTTERRRALTILSLAAALASTLAPAGGVAARAPRLARRARWCWPRSSPS